MASDYPDDLDEQIERAKADYHASFLTMVGALVITWAHIERAVDVLVQYIHDHGGTAIQNDLPPTLDRELDYLKEALQRRLLPHPIADEVASLMERIHQLKDFRHNLVHGIVDLDDPKRIIADNRRVKGSSRVATKTPYSPERVVKNVQAGIQLRRDLTALIFRGRGTEDREEGGC